MNEASLPVQLDLEQYGTALRRGTLSIEQMVRAYLDRIATLNPALNAYAYVAHEEAISSAQSLDRLIKKGVDLGPLMGVPIGIKDNIKVDGMPCLAGSDTDVASR